jgi:hypothetical protein
MKINKNDTRLKLLKKIVGDNKYKELINSNLKGKIILIPKKCFKAEEKVIELYLLHTYSEKEIAVKSNCCEVYVHRVIKRYERGK